jgi:23S rRNA (cytosine1962-C5)-methyltransferase
MGNLAVRVTKDAARQIRGGHPWVFDASVVSVKPDGVAGDLAVIFDEDRRFMAVGLYDPDSPIRIKVLHHGRPATIDAEFWHDRITAALGRRAALVQSSVTTAYRVVHGENDGMPGFVLDRYGDHLVIKIYSPAWLPHLATIVGVATELLSPSTIVLRFSRSVARGDTGDWADASALLGELPTGPITFRENGLTFEADIVHGPKTGYFLDQRDNRRRVRDLSAGQRVLDVFSSVGGFTVHAAAGGATQVHSVDISQHAIDATRRNLALNTGRKAVAACRHFVTTGDAFEVMAHLATRPERFDIVIIDPPSFASRRDQVPAALRAYARLTALAVSLVARNGILVQSSCSSRVTTEDFVSTVRSGAHDAGMTLDVTARTAHAVDHPIGFAEGAYLKAVFARVTR